MTPQAVQRAIRAFIAKGSGFPPERVIPGNDPGRRPVEPYATALVVSDHIEMPTMERYRAIPPDSEDTIIDAVQTRRARVSIQFFREQTADHNGAYTAARNFTSWIEQESGLQAADRAGFRLDGPISVRRLDDIVSSNWEERAGVEIEVLYRYREPASQDVGTMENAVIEIKGPAESQIERIERD